ncbi:MAG TPA: hypothetical protein PKA63_02630 [Oligoflexia bacterium]|nr:hypothetical protein [Oligoflexia bacterium]HMP47548.1 hypothetical protein [Oligoflexia bacterium]
MEIVIYALLGLPLFLGACWGLAKLASREEVSDASERLKEIDSKLASLDPIVEKAVEYAENLDPLSLAIERRNRESELKDGLSKELAKLADLEKKLANLQKQVEVAEESHNELKRGKEESESLAKLIKERKKELENENENIKTEIEKYLAQITSLATTKKLSSDQNAGTKIIFNSLTNASKQLETLSSSYNQASTRFLNLQTQFSDLEKEFTKLVEKELTE